MYGRAAGPLDYRREEVERYTDLVEYNYKQMQQWLPYVNPDILSGKLEDSLQWFEYRTDGTVVEIDFNEMEGIEMFIVKTREVLTTPPETWSSNTTSVVESIIGAWCLWTSLAFNEFTWFE